MFITPNDWVSFNTTTFPEGSFRVSERASVYWEVECKFDNGELFLEVLDYSPQSLESFHSQVKKRDIDRITFKNLNWGEFERLLSSYSKQLLLPFLDPLTLAIKGKSEEADNFTRRMSREEPVSFAYNPSEISKSTDLEIAYGDATFGDGFVSFVAKVQWHYEPIRFRIINSNVVSEFETIKTYFAKAINGRKRFTVSVFIKTKGGELIEALAVSEDIEKIDSSLIEGIKVSRVNKLTSSRVSNSSKSIFTADEIFSNLQQEQNVFKQSEGDLLNMIIEIKKVRNRKPLFYLSNRQQVNEKLRFTLRPNFGFLFFIKGKTHNYFCFELLESNATYVWSLPLTLISPFARIEGTIRNLQEMGREQYRNSYQSGEIDSDIVFKRVAHSDISSNEEKGFSDWKEKIDAILL